MIKLCTCGHIALSHALIGKCQYCQCNRYTEKEDRMNRTMVLQWVEEQLNKNPPHRPSMKTIRMLLEVAREGQNAIRDVAHLTELYSSLVVDYNGVMDVIKNELGIVIYMPAGSDLWTWEYQGQTGTAPSIPEAFRAAIRPLPHPRLPP